VLSTIARAAERIRRRPGATAVAAAVLASQLVPAPAGAEVRLSGEAGANYSVRVMSWWEIPFRSVIRQKYDYSCGSAAVATLLTYHYRLRTPEQFAFERMWEAGDQAIIRKSGFSMLDMKNLLSDIGYRAEGVRISIDEIGARKLPAIVLLNLNGYKHFVVVKGVRSGTVLVGDPMLGLSQYSKADFAKVWNGIALAVLVPPKPAAPAFNLASDWGPWAKAPLEENALHVPVGSLTSNLPPLYQVTPETLFDVRSGTVTTP
jgi:predicted double-glycine peptidase